ncbi:MAG: SUMF1/EgtB/PvdO family nonheme iron enzyme, partial [Myxococcota bacterium]
VAPAPGEERPTVVGASGREYALGPTPIGVGGQAEVWPAIAPDGTRVALKIAHPAPTARAAITQEAALLEGLAAAGFGHAVVCLDRVEGDSVGFVMPLYGAELDGHVARRVAEAGGAGIEAVLGVAAELARALAGLHAVTIPGQDGRLVHRDVKPENVLVDENGRLLLADFGGSLVVDGPGSLELGVFGSPMWAPFDQMLPGLPEPNPTWDTYAACVMLFWWVTGGRPAYQADPWPMLTERGRATWAALCALGEAVEAPARQEAVKALFAARDGTRAAELVDVRGHGAIQDTDREALAAGVRRLGDPALYGEAALADAARELADLLARGLSPLSHPSPPNRFWKAADLVAEIDAVTARLVAARRARAGEVERAGLREQVKASGSKRKRWLAGAAAGGAALTAMPALLVLAWMYDPAREAPPEGPDVVGVAAGTTVHGDVWGDGEDDERPTRTVALDAFRIHRTEVSNAAYAACVGARVCSPLAWQDPASPYHLTKGAGATFRDLAGDQQPAVGVTWQQAVTWCAWAGGRLPTEEEWEKAATAAAADGLATDKRRWPWGAEDPDCTRVNMGACRLGRTIAVDTLPLGESAWGARHLAGNVWEWTSGSYTVVRRQLFKRSTEERKVLRGGSYDSTVAALRPTFRRHADPDGVSPLHGFRCVFDPQKP